MVEKIVPVGNLRRVSIFPVTAQNCYSLDHHDLLIWFELAHPNVAEHDLATTYKELKKQAEALLQQAEEARLQEVNTVIESIRAQVEEDDLTPDDIFGRRKRATTAKKSALPPKYQDPKTGATWSGHGRAPAWIRDAKNRDKFLIREA